MRKKSQLHEYQQQAIDWLYEHDAALALLPVGAGKSVIGWTTAQELMRAGHIKRPLVFAPMRVAQLVWPAERKEWEHLQHEPIVTWGGEPSSWADSPWKESRILWGKINSIVGRLPSIKDTLKVREAQAKLKNLQAEQSAINRALQKIAPPECLHVTSYENLMWLCELYEPGKSPFDLWIFDEIGKLKNPKSPRYKEVRKHTAQVKTVWGLNATPAPEGFEDLFTQVNIVDGGKLWGKSFYQWRQRYFAPVDFHGYKWRPQIGAKELLLNDLNSLAFRVDESELAYQRSMAHSQIKVILPPKARGLYDQMEREMMASVPDTDVTAFSAAAACMKLRQITQGFIYDEEGKAHIVHEEKQHALADLIDELGGEPLLVAYEFSEDLEAIRRVWKNVPYLGQGISAAKAEEHVTRWNKRELPVLALHPYSAGHGLNLQKGGSHIAWYALPWPLESFIQTNGRIDRQGQTRACFAHHIVAQNSMDERVSEALQRKDADQEAIIRAIRKV